MVSNSITFTAPNVSWRKIEKNVAASGTLCFVNVVQRTILTGRTTNVYATGYLLEQKKHMSKESGRNLSDASGSDNSRRND